MVEVEKEIAKISPVLKRKCLGVVDVPKKLTLSKALKLWAKDRKRLGECANRHDHLRKAVEVIEKQFGGSNGRR